MAGSTWAARGEGGKITFDSARFAAELVGNFHHKESFLFLLLFHLEEGVLKGPLKVKSPRIKPR